MPRMRREETRHELAVERIAAALRLLPREERDRACAEARALAGLPVAVDERILTMAMLTAGKN